MRIILEKPSIIRRLGSEENVILEKSSIIQGLERGGAYYTRKTEYNAVFVARKGWLDTKFRV